MSDLNFHSPLWFWGLLILIPLVALRLRSSLSRRNSLPGLVSPRLQDQLVSPGRQIQRWSVFVLQCLALVGTLTALARPQLGFDEVKTEVESRNLFFAIDTSRSMLATDLRPNRLDRAKLAAVDIVRSLPEDRIGLIAFAGRPFLQAPLTVDHEAILESLDQLDTEIIPRGGTNITAAITLALETIAEAKVEQSALVIFSDGEALEGMNEVERVRAKANEAGLTIIAVGVGTEDGSIIPELDDRGNPIPGVFVKDETGQVVRTRLDATALQTAAAQGGVYVHLGGATSLGRVVSQIQNGITASREESDSRLRPIERFLWPLGYAVACLILSHLLPVFWTRSSRSFALHPAKAVSIWLVLGTFFVPFLTVADDALFVGHEAFQKQEYDAAIEAYEGALSDSPSSNDVTRLNLALGAAAFRKGDFERAAEAYGQALIEPKDSFREHAHYNLGNTLFRQGEAALQSLSQSSNPDQMQSLGGPPEEVDEVIHQWETALEHYESAIELNQSNEKAAHNIEVVKQRIEDLKKEQEQQEQQQQDQQEDENQDDQEREKRDQEEDQEQSNEQNQEQNSDDEQEQNPEEKEDESESENNENESSEEERDQENNGEKEEEPQDESGSEGENEEPSQPENQGGSEPEQPEAPEDGELEANPNESQPQGAPPMRPQEMQKNPETGYAPTEARKLLEALADETEVRPVLAPSRGENYKNW